MSVKRQLLLRIQEAMYYTGAAAAYVRCCVVQGAVILMYHSVAGDESSEWIDPANNIQPGLFESQLRYLARNRNVVSVDEVVAAIQGGRVLPAGSVALTFDDGYLNTLETAAPLLERYQLPALVYLPTNYIHTGRPQWIDELYSAFVHRTRGLLTCPRDGAVYDLTDVARRRIAYRASATALLEADVAERQSLLTTFLEQLRPRCRSPRSTMIWDDVRKLRSRYPLFAVGVHTQDHLDLSKHSSLATVQVRGSVADVERELGECPRHFSFPYGRTSPAAKHAVMCAGLDSAVSAGDRVLIDHLSDRFALPRIDVPRSYALFRLYTSGAHPGLSEALFAKA